jgi:hypothetical protein
MLLFANDVVAELDALVANEHGRTGNELAHFVLALATKRAIQKLAVVPLATRLIAHKRRTSASKQASSAL